MKNEILNEMTEEQLSEVSGGKTVDKYKFYDIGTKSQKAYIEVEDGNIKSSWGLDQLNQRDKDQIPENIRRSLGL
ncbi:MAG: hypothetical protein IJ758_02205 [Clostridia bacterium]|nr:hypothetical protein [Clostridia bacterium]